MIGWFVLLAFLFAATDVAAVNDSGGAVFGIFNSALDPWAAKLIVLIATIGQLFCGAAGLTSASRTWYAFSRDRGMPGWALFGRVNRDRVPFNAVIAVSVASLVIAIPALFGKNDIPFAFFALTGICTVGLYLAYIIPVYLRLRRGDAFETGPWNLGRRYRVVNVLAIIFVIVVVFSLNLPYDPRACHGTMTSTLRTSTTRRSRSSAADLRRLVAGLGQGPLPGPGPHAGGRRGHARLSGPRGSRRRPGGHVATPACISLDELRRRRSDGTVDTVLLTIADMEGRLQGKRLTARHFLDEVVEHGAEGCNYLLAVDVDMDTVAGYEMSSWERGYGDFVMKPDLDTLRPIPWHEGTVLLMADILWEDGADVVASPRQILRRQLDRLAERGWSAAAGTELEFIIFRDTYEDAWDKDYRDLDPANLYNVDYSMLGTARVEPLIRRIRNSMMAAEMQVENSKGECNFGQHEINFHYGDALATADDHVIYKNGAKEIAAQEGMSITFMAKFNEAEGNSCHIHCSVADEAGENVFAAEPRRSTASSPASSPACAS